MLQQLIIQNFTLVEYLHLEFDHNMTAISGETGAGKSVLLGALGLALGERAEFGNVRQGADKADIHAVFDIQHHTYAQDYLATHHLTQEEDPHTCILRRLINEDGRSRGYINGKPVSISNLKQMGQQLVNIYGQQEHQHLLARDSYLKILDNFGDYQTLLNQVTDTSDQWHELAKQAKQLGGTQSLSEAEYQLLTYQTKELDALSLQEGEWAQLQQDHQQLSKADALLQAIQAALPESQPIDAPDPKTQLQTWYQQLAPYIDTSPHLANAVDMLANAVIHIEESQQALQSFLNTFNRDPKRLHTIEARLEAVYNVARKHNIQPDQLLAHQQSLHQRLILNQSQQATLEDIKQQQMTLAQEYQTAALALSNARKHMAQKLTQSIGQQLNQLGMTNCHLDFAIQTKALTDPLTIERLGIDNVDIMIQTNPGMPAKPLAKVASGGELSRISLAIQVVIAHTSITPTLIFDEVDVGIGGATAEIVGRLLAQLGQHCQLLCITHLPQVASQAQQHLQVSKDTHNNHTFTQVAALSQDERIQEIARMLGGVKVTEQTLAHAKEMLGSGRLH